MTRTILSKLMLMLLVLVFIACEAATDKSTTEKEPNSEERQEDTIPEVPKEKIETPKAVDFSTMKQLKLPMKIKKSESLTDDTKLTALGLSFQEKGEPFKYYIEAKDGIKVGMKCYYDQFLSYVLFVVLDDNGKEIGKSEEITYYGSSGSIGGSQSTIDVSSEEIFVSEKLFSNRYEMDGKPIEMAYRITKEGIVLKDLK